MDRYKSATKSVRRGVVSTVQVSHLFVGKFWNVRNHYLRVFDYVFVSYWAGEGERRFSPVRY